MAEALVAASSMSILLLLKLLAMPIWILSLVEAMEVLEDFWENEQANSLEENFLQTNCGASGLMNAFRLSLTDLTGEEERKGDDDFLLDAAELVPLF